MEVGVFDHPGLGPDAVVSVRFGSTRRQAALSAASEYGLKFPCTVEACCEPLKIDVFQPIASTRLVLRKNEEQYRVSVAENSLGLRIRNCSVTAHPSDLPAATSALPESSLLQKDAAASARDYLDNHGLLRYVQSLLHAIIQMRPDDPYAYMKDQLDTQRSIQKSARPQSAPLGRPCPGSKTAPPKTADPAAENGTCTRDLPSSTVAWSPKDQTEVTRDALSAQETSRGTAAQTSQTEDLRQQMRDVLETACADGRLVSAIEKVVSPTSYSGAAKAQDIANAGSTLEGNGPRDVDVMRKSRSLLEDAARDGSLESVLNKSAVEESKLAPNDVTSFAVDDSVNDARAKMRALLESALDDGSLERYMISTNDKVTGLVSSQVEETRSKMQCLLASAVDDGSLECLLSDRSQKPNNETAVQGSSERNIEDLRVQMRMRMEEALDSGELAAALRPKQLDSTAAVAAEDSSAKELNPALATTDADMTDSPGLYKIVKFTFASTTMILGGERRGDLNPGETVNVLEVVNNLDEQRIRGRLTNCTGESGWITLADTSSGERFATKAGRADPLAPAPLPVSGDDINDPEEIDALQKAVGLMREDNDTLRDEVSRLSKQMEDLKSCNTQLIDRLPNT